MLIVLLGPPGAGKGTHGARLSAALGLPCLSTGNMLRHAVSGQSALGESIGQYLARGALVPDAIVCDIVRHHLSMDEYKSGAILDGFPRNLYQARKLNETQPVDHAVLIDVDDQEIVERMSGRRNCPNCGASYHVMYNRPRREDVCDRCGHTPLEMREDDTPELVRERLRVYHELTEPIKDFYTKLGVLRTVRGQDKPDDTTRLIFDAVGIVHSL